MKSTIIQICFQLFVPPKDFILDIVPFNNIPIDPTSSVKLESISLLSLTCCLMAILILFRSETLASKSIIYWSFCSSKIAYQRDHLEIKLILE